MIQLNGRPVDNNAWLNIDVFDCRFADVQYLPGRQVKKVKKTGFRVRETKHRSSSLNGGHQAYGGHQA